MPTGFDPCSCCQNGGPDQFQLVISGVANTSPPTCSTCNNLNGTYILNSTAMPCQWTGSGLDCGLGSVGVEISQSGDSHNFAVKAGALTMFTGSGKDCLTAPSLAVGPSPPAMCDWAAAEGRLIEV